MVLVVPDLDPAARAAYSRPDTVSDMDTPDISRRDTVRRVVALTTISFLLLIGIESVGNRVLAGIGRWNLVIVLGVLVCCFALARRGGRNVQREVRRSENLGGARWELEK